jgi:methyl-accepting chemotaxis protein
MCCIKTHKSHRRLLAQLKGSEHARLDLTHGAILNILPLPSSTRKGSNWRLSKNLKIAPSKSFTEQEINHVIHAASQGDFSGRIDLENKTGFFRSFAEALNQILDYNELAIKDLMKVFSALSKGDLTLSIENNYLGSLDQLKQDINTTIRLLNEVLITIQQSASAVNQAAEEISQGHISLSQRTEEQAASLEETAASMEEMTSTVQQNADNARQATQLASSARTYAEQGSKVVNNAVTAMAKINDSSKKIADIIGVIDDIAFQTNLLALNAAVEAARAGEQGRGFAVVATEVRNLAQRSATAAKEIKNLIRDSVNKVEEGTALVNQSGETLTEIVTAVKRVSDIIAEIAAASQEQSSGIQQVNKAVAQMDEMTQQNAALVEEATAAGESMSHESQSLREQVGFFIINTRYLDAINEPGSSPSTSIRSRTSNPLKKTNYSTKKSAKPALASKQTSEDGWEDF